MGAAAAFGEPFGNALGSPFGDPLGNGFDSPLGDDRDGVIGDGAIGAELRGGSVGGNATLGVRGTDPGWGENEPGACTGFMGWGARSALIASRAAR